MKLDIDFGGMPHFFMNSPNFMNVVRFKLKSDCVDKYFEVIDKTSFEGMTQRYIAKTGDYNYCFVGIWKSAEAIAAQRPAMIAHLDEVRGFMEELSPELGVTDPVSGNIVSKVGYHDWESILKKFYNISIHFKIYNSILNTLS